MLMFSTLTIGFTFISMSHPLAMGLVLLLQTLFISLMTGLLAPSFWFSYILFLVFLGGMLVLFIYVTSLASNEMFSISSKTLFGCLIFLILIFSISLINDPSVWVLPDSFNSSTQATMFSSYDLHTLLTKLYSSPTHFLTLLLVSYLFLTLIAVVTITQIFEGPLRSKY
uniref:NADH dehydrogenase subunit 6 n=1 Tax=Notacanthurus lamellosus TaxID=2873652 RepID=UPI002176BCF6|nr:NADH dehydrogenase subunit 6 [Notacanthurus lamellosus]QZZ23929.1 NADH dehydrogenase subunit 6 [Notacanthurus lamellosus]